MADSGVSQAIRPGTQSQNAHPGDAPNRRMRILTYSTLFPNALRPYHGVFVENRLRHLVEEGTVESRVVAPVAWFPFRGRMFGDYAINAAVAATESRHGIDIEHPRYPLIPKFGMTTAPWLMYRWTLPVLQRIRREGYDFDLIDSHYFYPDGIAAVMLGRALGKPVTVTARGTDINLIPKYRLPRKMILWAAGQSAGMITVCAALKDELVALGADEAKVRVLRNGVDLKMFSPRDRDAARAKFGISGKTVVSVGHLIERKGHNLVIEALPELPDVSLAIAGDGPEDAALKALAERLGVRDRVNFLGRLGHAELPDLYSAADILVLASSREGWDGLRHAGGGLERVGHARGRYLPGIGPPAAGTHRSRHRASGQGNFRRRVRFRRNPRLCGKLQLGRDDPGTDRAVSGNSRPGISRA